MKGKEQRRATIVDVAKYAGVSKSTVARVLEGKITVSEEASARVLKAIATLGYERNRLAMGMRSGRTGLLAIVIPDITNPFWADVTRGAQDRAIKEGYSLLVFSSDWDAEKEAAHLRAIRQARVDGAIINPVADNFDSLGFFGMPFVFIGSSAERFPEVSSVGSDIKQGVHLGLSSLQKRGHDLPSVIVGPKSRLARIRFLHAITDYCIGQDIDPGQLTVESGDYTVDGGFQSMNRLLRQRNATQKHLTVFAANDLMALGAMMAVRQAGLRCCEDVSILGFDGIPAGEFSYPGLTTIKKPSRQIGERAMDCLLDEIDGHRGQGRIHLPCELIERGSVADLTG
ncbi:LacI family DNA-binding transcriptional regulator [Pluralibacter sp.]|uniref:LacI family DNA-binding transcriptional regulator n=1 Tax=Pluralibacter sp. TaxID=1920032 RepID=UPI0025EBCD12|nr:LacI family DNA-binding transcriptional regulator [Pluralibacter sp.]MBV8043083.1 LacI family DNA-binding transcriptional regulator [Pluralibacter sp.]